MMIKSTDMLGAPVEKDSSTYKPADADGNDTDGINGRLRTVVEKI